MAAMMLTPDRLEALSAFPTTACSLIHARGSKWY